ncbi:MAG: hypothetical protein ACLQPD_12945 [Desulfomonilaceae bacterium]
MKKQHTPPQQTMLQVLQGMAADGAVKASAYRFLKANFSMLQSEESFKRAYHGLLCAQQLLGPLDSNYRKSLVEMRKSLDSFARRFQVEALQEAAFFRVEARDLWYALLNTTRNHLPYPNWYNFYQSGREVFGKEP